MQRIWISARELFPLLNLNDEEGVKWFRQKLNDWESVDSTKDLDNDAGIRTIDKLRKLIVDNTQPEEGT